MVGPHNTLIQELAVYCPTHFAETRPEVLHELIVAHPLGTLITHAHGRLRAIDDPAWVQDQLRAMTDQHETTQAQP